jgi:hypothetical protein
MLGLKVTSPGQMSCRYLIRMDILAKDSYFFFLFPQFRFSFFHSFLLSLFSLTPPPPPTRSSLAAGYREQSRNNIYMDKGRKKNRRDREEKIPQEWTTCPHGSHSTCKLEPQKKRPGQNSSGLVNRTTIVKHLPYILAISFFFFHLLLFGSAPPRTKGPSLMVERKKKRERERYLRVYMLISIAGYFHYKETAVECINKWISCCTGLAGRCWGLA